jgi:type II secretory pathway component GspD/PulD (secretin)
MAHSRPLASVIIVLALLARTAPAFAQTGDDVTPTVATAAAGAPAGRDSNAAAQDSTPVAAPDEAAEITRLEALPASRIPLKSATLASAIRLLAETAKMPYLAPPDADFNERITSDVVMNPYRLLQVLEENYNFACEYDQGIWRFYRINLNELVTKAYTLRFNDPDQITVTASSINSQLASTGGSGGGTPGAGSAAGNANASFNTKTGKIIDDIKKILGLPTVGIATPSLDGSPAMPAGDASRHSMEAPKVDPIWNPDTNQLFVVATRQQHSLIAAYLKAIDKPQKLIRISVKFVETSRNPTQALGVDWSNTFLGSGGPVSLSGIPTGTGTTTSTGTTSTQTNLPISTNVNLNHPFPISLPTALLSAPAFQYTIQAIASDQCSSIVQDPVIFTSNNRAVSFDATTQQPIQEGTTTIGSATAATTSTIAYIDVGTELNILPSILPGSGRNRELVQLAFAINVSSVIGQQTINGNPYPVTSSRTYNYTVSIPNGETLAIAGLEERSRQTSDNKVPIFSDIPILGYAFKNKQDSIVHTTLMAFITPELIDGAQGTAAGEDVTPMPDLKHRVFQGSKEETLAQVDETLAGLPADIDALNTCANDSNRQKVLNRLERLSVELQLISVRLDELQIEDKNVSREEKLVEQTRGRLDATRDRVEKISSEQS